MLPWAQLLLLLPRAELLEVELLSELLLVVLLVLVLLLLLEEPLLLVLLPLHQLLLLVVILLLQLLPVPPRWLLGGLHASPSKCLVLHTPFTSVVAILDRACRETQSVDLLTPDQSIKNS